MFGWTLHFSSCSQDDLQSTVFNSGNHVTETDNSHAKAAVNGDFKNIFVYFFFLISEWNISHHMFVIQWEDAVQTPYHNF